MKASPRFAGATFHNPTGATPALKPGTALSTMSDFFLGGQRRVPLAPLPSESPIERWTRPVESGLRATWLGHSTVLVEIDGYRVLTDPVWGERASPVGFAGPKRFQPVPVPISGLPPLDAVIISHDHYDHLDHESILALVPLGVPFVTPLGVGAHLEAWGVPAERITELDWWESITVGGLTITAAPSQHFSGRGARDRNRTLWSSFAVRGPRRAFFFSGDTGLTPEYAEIRTRLGPFDLIMLEVGAFHPSWGSIHLGPENALEALSLLGGGSFLPVHWGTFNLAIHAWDEPAETLVELAPKRDVQLVMPRLGAPVEPAHVERVDAWWRPIAALEKKDRCGSKSAEPEAAPLEVGEPID
ncbi:Outer membrane protein romA [Minicystis rosea]|nr:Outer membrane protein romA [Minicystis rosea]